MTRPETRGRAVAVQGTQDGIVRGGSWRGSDLRLAHAGAGQRAHACSLGREGVSAWTGSKQDVRLTRGSAMASRKDAWSPLGSRTPARDKGEGGGGWRKEMKERWRTIKRPPPSLLLDNAKRSRGCRENVPIHPLLSKGGPARSAGTRVGPSAAGTRRSDARCPPEVAPLKGIEGSPRAGPPPPRGSAPGIVAPPPSFQAHSCSRVCAGLGHTVFSAGVPRVGPPAGTTFAKFRDDGKCTGPEMSQGAGASCV